MHRIILTPHYKYKYIETDWDNHPLTIDSFFAFVRCVELIASGSNLSISFRSNIWSIYNPSPCTIGILNLLFKDASSITLYKNSGIISNRQPHYKLWFWWNILKTGLDTDPRLCIFAAHAFAPPLYNVQLLLNMLWSLSLKH